MELSHKAVSSWAAKLIDARDDQKQVEPITSTSAISIEDAYRVQRAVVDCLEADGQTVIGAKLGLTSRAKQVQLGAEQPIFGVLTDSMILDEQDGIKLSELCHPRCEPEIVFRLAEDLSGVDITPVDVLDATASVHGGIEVVDSRFLAPTRTLVDVIADNSSAARFVVGEVGVEPREFDLTVMGCTFEHNSDVSGTATGAALLGDPAACVALLVAHLAARGQTLPAGSIILAGSLTGSVAARAGDRFAARYAGLGRVSVCVS